MQFRGDRFERWIQQYETRTAAAAAIGISYPTLRHWVTGRFGPSVRSLSKLIEVSGKPLKYWIREDL